MGILSTAQCQYTVNCLLQNISYIQENSKTTLLPVLVLLPSSQWSAFNYFSAVSTSSFSNLFLWSLMWKKSVVFVPYALQNFLI